MSKTGDTCPTCGHKYYHVGSFPRWYVLDIKRTAPPEDVLYPGYGFQFFYNVGPLRGILEGRDRIPKEFRNKRYLGRFKHNGIIYVRNYDLPILFEPFIDITQEVRTAITTESVQRYFLNLEMLKGETVNRGRFVCGFGRVIKGGALNYSFDTPKFEKKGFRFTCEPSTELRDDKEREEAGKGNLDIWFNVISQASSHGIRVPLAKISIEGRIS